MCEKVNHDATTTTTTVCVKDRVTFIKRRVIDIFEMYQEIMYCALSGNVDVIHNDHEKFFLIL